jgi:hypothetical protein
MQSIHTRYLWFSPSLQGTESLQARTDPSQTAPSLPCFASRPWATPDQCPHCQLSLGRTPFTLLKQGIWKAPVIMSLRARICSRGTWLCPSAWLVIHWITASTPMLYGNAVCLDAVCSGWLSCFLLVSKKKNSGEYRIRATTLLL